MRSIVEVTEPNTDKQLTTLARVKRELNITGEDAERDVTLNEKIDEASDDIEAALGFHVGRETVRETFWHDQQEQNIDRLILDRTPVAAITSVTVDGLVIDPSLYRFDAATGELFVLTPSGLPFVWLFYKSVIVVYAGGYILPAETGSNLPAGIQGACVELLSDYWAAKGRDPSVKSEEIPGVSRVDYWIGAVGEAGELPPRVVMKIAPYRRAIA
ncbi:phage head-tail connector protein (plasmid) [Bradyrhizobium oligotrophicum S58]